MRTAAECEVAKASIELQRLESRLDRIIAANSGACPSDREEAYYNVLIQRLEVERLQTYVTKERAMSEKCDVTPADMGFTEEVIDIIKKADVKVETVIANVKQTGAAAVAALSEIVKAVWNKKAIIALVVLLLLGGRSSAQNRYMPPADRPAVPPVYITDSFTEQEETPAKKANCGCVVGDPCTCGANCTCSITYKQAYAAAVKSGRPVAVFVGQPTRPIKGFVICRSDETFPDLKLGVMVGMKNGKGDIAGYSIIGRPDDASIRNTAYDVEVALRPISLPPQLVPQTTYSLTPYVTRPYIAGYSQPYGGCANGNCSRR